MRPANQSSQAFEAGGAASHRGSAEIAVGQLLQERYRADALLGRGGMGEVWRCHDLHEGRDVAIKTVLAEHLANPNAWRLFQAEVMAVARLTHPGIVGVYDLLQTNDGGSLLVMEYRPGESLDAALKSDPSWSLVRTILVQLLKALAHAHARSVLHLDIKPGNVLVEKRDDGVRTTLVDFGIARVKRPGRGAEQWFDNASVVGTVEYMAPEQCCGELEKFGPWTDLYALGMMIYELCSGSLPQEYDNLAEAIRRRVTEPVPKLVPRIRSVPDGFEELCAHMLAMEPRDRPSCAADVLALLEHIDPREAFHSDLRGLSSLPPPPDAMPSGLARSEASTLASEGVEVGPTMAAPNLEPPTLVPTKPDAPTLLAARARLEDVFAELDREEQTPSVGLSMAPGPMPTSAGAGPSSGVVPPSSHRDALEAAEAFTAERTAPTPGAYGLFGLRELPVLGRVAERRLLWSTVGGTALENRTTGVQLIGPAGTGKSRLARDAAERALELGLCTVMQTHWSSSGSADEGIVGMLENVLESRGYREREFETRLAFWLARLDGDREALAHELRVLLRPEADAAPDAGLPVRVAVEAIARAAKVRPVLLWLDDVQWSRGEASALVQGLAALTPEPAVCVLATVREEETSGGDQHQAFVAALHKLCLGAGTTPETVPMKPLGIKAARTMVRGLLNLEPKLRELIAQRSEGNPLFATQLVRQLVVERAVVRRGARYGLANDVDVSAILPADIGAVWARRVELSGAAEADLRALAIVRERVSREVVDALLRLAGPTLSASIDRAQAAGLLRLEEGRYAWTHGLLRSYLLGSVPSEEAAELHSWAGDALMPLIGREDVQEERATHLSKAARHAEACEAMLDASLWCWRRAERAGRKRRAETMQAWAEQYGLGVLEARALAELGSSHADQGEAERAESLLRRAHEKLAGSSHASTAAAWINFRHSQALRLAGNTESGADYSRQAAALANEGGEIEIEALSLLQLATDTYRRGEGDKAMPLYETATEVARRSNNRGTVALALVQQSQLATPAQGAELLERAIKMSRNAGALRIELMARQLWVDNLWQIEQRERARREARTVSREAARRGMRQTTSIIELQAACWAAQEEDWNRVREHQRAAGKWGARSGALPERAFVAALDALIAIVDNDSVAALAAVEKLQCEAKGYSEATFVQLLTKATTLAPPDVAARLLAFTS